MIKGHVLNFTELIPKTQITVASKEWFSSAGSKCSFINEQNADQLLHSGVAGFSHFSNFISSVLHPPPRPLEIGLSTSRWRMPQFLKSTWRAEAIIEDAHVKCFHCQFIKQAPARSWNMQTMATGALFKTLYSYVVSVI